MVYKPNDLANIVSAVGHTSGDCFVKDYDPNFDWLSNISPDTWEQDLISGKIDSLGFVNVGHITTDGALEIQTPDIEDNTTTTDLIDGIAVKRGTTSITGQHAKFTLIETVRDDTIKFINGYDAIDNSGAFTTIKHRGKNPKTQSIIFPLYRSDNRVELVIVECANVVIDDVIKYSPNEPMTFAIDIDPLTGANLKEGTVSFVSNPLTPTPPTPQKSDKPKEQ